MSRIRGKDTSPERLLRSALWRAGLRFRLQARTPHGRPDVVFSKARVSVSSTGASGMDAPNTTSGLGRATSSGPRSCLKSTRQEHLTAQVVLDKVTNDVVLYRHNEHTKDRNQGSHSIRPVILQGPLQAFQAQGHHSPRRDFHRAVLPGAPRLS
ncbi:MAG: hypothetical protein ACXU86_00595 [Archangium sp.]